MIDGYYSVYPPGYVTVVNSLNNEDPRWRGIFLGAKKFLYSPLSLSLSLTFTALEKFIIYDRKFTVHGYTARRSNLSDNHPDSEIQL